MDPWSWLTQFCSFGFISIVSPLYLFCSGFPYIREFWSRCLSLHWLSVKLKGDVPFHRIPFHYSRACWNGLFDHLRDASWEDILKLRACVAASEVCDCVQVRIDVYYICITYMYIIYQVKPHSSPWFSSACAAEVAFINQFYRFYKQNKSCVCKAMLRKATNCWKRVLEAAKLANANKKRVHHLKTWLSQVLSNC